MRFGDIAKKHYLYEKQFVQCRFPAELRKREIYTNKNYFHEDYKSSNNSIWDHNDDVLDIIIQNHKNKGLKNCFCIAIEGPNLNVNAAKVRAKIHEAGVVHGSIQANCSKSRSYAKFPQSFSNINTIVD
jgi:hypothetical protein